MLAVNAIHLSEDGIGPACTTVRQKMIEKYGAETVEKRLPVDDWARWSLLVDKLENTPSLLDVGVAHATFLNSLACHGKMGRMVGIDIREYSMYSQMYPGFECQLADVTHMPYNDGEFHTVTCMEVIEHLSDEDLPRAISELRRVASNRLIISVPFCEGLPLYKGHFQRFSTDRIKKLFPAADYTLLIKDKKGSTPWLIIEENKAA